MKLVENNENLEMDWKKEFKELFKDDPGAMVWLKALDKPSDQFIPRSSHQILDRDIESLLDIFDQINNLTRENFYFKYYKKIIGKLIILAIDNYPDVYKELSNDQKDVIMNLKIELPNENLMYDKIYTFLLRHQELPFGMINNGYTMDSTMDLVLSNFDRSKNKKDLQRIKNILVESDNQYREYFEEKKL